jgi:outer membrane protein TolC
VRLLFSFTATVALAGCAPKVFVPRPLDAALLAPQGAEVVEASRDIAARPGMSPPPSAPLPDVAQPISGELGLDAVLASVATRYPPLLAKLLQRDLASGRLQQAMGSFDTYLSAEVGGRVQGYYESTVAQGLLEQPLATGDTIYGGYRISDGLLPDYYRDRTQGDGEVVFGGRVPLLQNRRTDGRRAGVRIAELGVQLAEPEIRRARITFVREATSCYVRWRAAGQRLAIARELLRLADDRDAGLRRAVERQFLAPFEPAARRRPELELLQLRIDQARAEADLAANQTLPQLDVVVEGAASLSGRPYADREDLELFVGGQLKVPIQRRRALGELQQAEAKRSKLRIEQGFLQDRISNELLDARSAMRAAAQQVELNEQNVDRAALLVTAEQRKFDLGLSNLLNVQLREGQLASARAQRVDARLRFDLARAAYRAALGYAAE